MDFRGFLIPAVDIREGKVVRLYRGEFGRVSVYPYTPAEVARIFDSAGFERIHVVDLDGAQGGRPRNLRHIADVRRAFRGTVEVGGGIRSYDVARALFEEGVDLVVVGTLAVRDPDELGRILADFPERVILSIDAKGGKVSVGGWREESAYTPAELARIYDTEPIWGYLYTIVERDGSLEGVDVEPYREIRRHVSKPLLASGGVSSLKDVEKLYGVVDGVVVGKAIYEGRIPVEGLSPRR